jgi:cysteine-rich repeat protein
LSDYTCGNGKIDGISKPKEEPVDFELPVGDPRIEECDSVNETKECNLSSDAKKGSKLPTDCKKSFCGDGYVNKAPSGEKDLDGNVIPNEVCDDGPEKNGEDGRPKDGDGCSADCKSNETCGNGIVDRVKGEICDNGKDNGKTGKCSKDCLSTGLCGNGLVDVGFKDSQLDEDCDFCKGKDTEKTSTPVSENAIDPENQSRLHNPSYCGALFETESCTNLCKTSVCGDNYINATANEECDTTDGKDSEECNGSSAPRDLACHKRSCGDGYINRAVLKECDKFDDKDPTVCKSHLLLETCDGFDGNDSPTCNGRKANKGVACHEPKCGDGYVNAEAGEECDEGQTSVGAGSRNCNGTDAGNNKCKKPKCGDGYVNIAAQEECDEGEASRGIGSATCNGTNAGPKQCKIPSCGDNYYNSADIREQCDSGLIDSATCNGKTEEALKLGKACTTSVCGDGYYNKADTHEQCDNGAKDSSNCNGNSASAIKVGRACFQSVCGDGYYNTEDIREKCDNGPSDSATCNGNSAKAIELKAACQISACGDGYFNSFDPREQCDGGPLDTPRCIGLTSVAISKSLTCHVSECGDGYLNPFDEREKCDYGVFDTPFCNGRTPKAVYPGVACQESICGDGYYNTADSREKCDNGSIDTATCNGNSAEAILKRANCQVPACGDGYRNPLNTNGGGRIEQCDSGITDTEICNGSTPDSKLKGVDCQLPTCGDGYYNTRSKNSVGKFEQCDGGTNDSPNCNGRTQLAIFHGVDCLQSVCGDGYYNSRDSTEQCDNGPVDSADCIGTGELAKKLGRTCQKSECGDGYLNTINEVCDDGNKVSGDGCNSTCEKEKGYDCSKQDSNGTSICEADCGDGYLVTGKETCDDFNEDPCGTCAKDCHANPEPAQVTRVLYIYASEYFSEGYAFTISDGIHPEIKFRFSSSCPSMSSDSLFSGEICVSKLPEHSSIEQMANNVKIAIESVGSRLALTVSEPYSSEWYRYSLTLTHTESGPLRNIDIVPGERKRTDTEGNIYICPNNSCMIEGLFVTKKNGGFGYDCSPRTGCGSDDDCESKRCCGIAIIPDLSIPGCSTDADKHKCMEPRCNKESAIGDGVKNGTETDVDCGGGSCNTCTAKQSCIRNADCDSKICCGSAINTFGNADLIDCQSKDDVYKCTSARCNKGGSGGDGVLNGKETDTDCGGPELNCDRCTVGDSCSSDGDCESNSCVSLTCTAASTPPVSSISSAGP